MVLYAFELSGEHETLPRSEALALLELYASGFRAVLSLDQCLVVEAQNPDLTALGRRLAMSYRIIEVLSVCEASLPKIFQAFQGMDLPRQSYRVRVRRVKNAPLRAFDVEREVGRALFRQGYQADLALPQMDIRGVITGETAILGRERVRADRSGFEGRRPHLKPFFYPGVLMPRIARALVNLSQVKEGEILLDPFSGTGGILVEACLIGAKGVGIDIQRKLVRGSLANLGDLDCSLFVGDAQRLPFSSRSLDAAVFDIPYGRSAIIRADSRDSLLVHSLEEVGRVLKERRRVVVVADRPIGGILEDASFELLERHTLRVHRSLTRHIYVCMV